MYYKACKAVQIVCNIQQARQWEFPSLQCWALFQISFRPQKEIKAKPGDEQTIHSGPFFMTLYSICKALLLACKEGDFPTREESMVQGYR